MVVFLEGELSAGGLIVCLVELDSDDDNGCSVVSSAVVAAEAVAALDFITRFLSKLILLPVAAEGVDCAFNAALLSVTS